MVRRSLVLALTFILAVILAVPAFAGSGRGTIVIVRIDHAPDEFVAGETYDVMYTVLWQGSTPVGGPSILEFNKGATQLEFEGTPTGTTGTFVAEVTLPESGSWTWMAMHGQGFTDMGTVDVEPFTVGRVLDHDIPALLLALIAAAGLASFLTRSKVTFASGIVERPARA